MDRKSPRFDQAFLQKQRLRLEKLRQDLLGSAAAGQAEETALQLQSVGETGEFEDDAQKLTLQDNDATLVDRNRQRLASIERALQKIEDGTYGLSDAKGETISRERLEAVPEAT